MEDGVETMPFLSIVIISRQYGKEDDTQSTHH